MKRKPNIPTNLDSFINDSKDTKIEEQQHTIKPKEIVSRKRQTYYIDDLEIEALAQMAFYEKIDKSEIVRQALQNYIPKKYFSLAIKER